jgi:pimeloyl-ACP methyl ester carboxylesterase
MLSRLRIWWQKRQAPAYVRREPLILINGLAEQAESWYRNVDHWRRHFDVHTPNLIAYDGTALQRRIEANQPIDIDYLVEQLRLYLDQFVQAPPYNLVANSLGGKVAVEFATRHPELVARLVLLCPAGLSDDERLPIVEGVRRNDLRSIIDSVFHEPSHADGRLLSYYQRQFGNRRWKYGLLRTVQGTKDHRVRRLLPWVKQPTLLVVGREDRIVDPVQTAAAGTLLPHGQVQILPGCGHAPQIEEAERVNRLVVDFLRRPLPTSTTSLAQG